MNKSFAMMIFLVLLAAGASALDVLDSEAVFTGNASTTVSQNITVNNTHPSATLSILSFDSLTLTHTTSSSRTKSLVFGSQQVNIPPNSTKVVELTFQILNEFAGTYTGQLFAYDSVNRSINDTLNVRLNVLELTGASVNNPSATVVKGSSGSAALTVTNTGNTNVPISVVIGEIKSGSNQLPVSLHQSNLITSDAYTLSYQEAKNVPLYVNLASTQVPAGTYSGKVSVTVAGSKQVNSTVTFTVEEPSSGVIFETAEVKIGSSDQERNVTESTTFTIKNRGTSAEGVRVNLTGISTKYNAQLSGPTSFTLDAGATQSYTLQLTIPKDEDSGSKSIGKLTVSGTNNTETKNIMLEVASKIKITDVDVKVGDNSDTNLGNGETIDDDASPGDKVEFTITVKNQYSRNELDMENIIVQVQLEDDNFGKDIDEESSEFDLDGSKDKEVVLSFTVPTDAEEDTYDVVLVAEGTDENDAKHIYEMTVKLKVNKERNDVRIIPDTNTVTLQCSRDTTLGVKVKNHGTDDQDEVVLTAYNSDLGVDEEFKMELDSDDDQRKTVIINAPSSLAAGSYPLVLTAYINGDDEDDKKFVDVKLQDCSPGTTTPPATSNTPTGAVVVQQPLQPQQQNLVESVEVPFTQRTEFIVLLVLANLVVLAVIILLVVKLAK